MERCGAPISTLGPNVYVSKMPRSRFARWLDDQCSAFYVMTVWAKPWKLLHQNHSARFCAKLAFALVFFSHHKSYNELASFLPGCGSEVRSLEQRHWLPGEAVWNGSGPRRPPSPSKLLAVGVQKNLPPTGTCL